MKEMIQHTVQILNEWWIILYPTETVRGLWWDPTNPDTVWRLHSLKWSPSTKPLTMLVWDIQDFLHYCPRVPQTVLERIEYAENPTTHIIPALWTQASNITHTLVSDSGISIRISQGSEFLDELFKVWKKPLMSTSANFHWQPSPKTRSEVEMALVAWVDFAVPGERDMVWVPSDIVVWTTDCKFRKLR